jgi:hypothetical protein
MATEESGRSLIERRLTERFPLHLEGELYCDDRQLMGETVNVSGGGLLMSCNAEMPVGTRVTVRLHWPVQQKGKPIVLVVKGEIVRREPCRVAILRREYDFEVTEKMLEN